MENITEQTIDSSGQKLEDDLDVETKNPRGNRNANPNGSARPIQAGSISSLIKQTVVEPKPRELVDINLRSLLEAGVHFGHQTSRWNPAMASYIYTARNGVHIINLPHTIQGWKAARKAIVDTAARGGNVLFVGTKKQSQEIIMEEAVRSGSFYVSHRWLGGMLTNFQTIRKSIDRMKKIEQIIQDEETAMLEGRPQKFKKKERLLMSKEHEKLNFALGGIRDMNSAPQLLFVIDIKREDIALKEAARLDIPVVALVDTNCDPRTVDFPIPSNDDGSRAIQLFAAAVADAIIEGKDKYADFAKRMEAEQKKADAKSRQARSEKAQAEKAKAEELSGDKLSSLETN